MPDGNAGCGAHHARPAGDKASAVKVALSRFLPTRFWQLIRLALAIVLLFRFGAIDLTNLKTALSSPGAVIAALLCNLVAIHLGIVRWQLLLRLQSVNVPFYRLWHITFISIFTGAILPGSLGQDAVRVYYAARDRDCSLGPAVTSVVADRLIGVTGLLVLASIFVFLNAKVITRSPTLQTFAQFTVGAAAVVLILLTVAAVLGHRPALRRRLRALTDESSTVTRIVGPAIEAARYYHRHIGGVLVCLAISVVVHLFMAMTVIVLATAIGVPGLDWLDIGLASLLSFLANAIPLTPGGLGIGEGVFDQLCRLLTTAPMAHSYGSAFFSARVVTIFVSLLGAVSYVLRLEKR